METTNNKKIGSFSAKQSNAIMQPKTQFPSQIGLLCNRLTGDLCQWFVGFNRFHSSHPTFGPSVWSSFHTTLTIAYG
jgi:hypothetical protein